MEKVYRATVKKPITLVAVLSHGKDIIMTDEDKKRIAEYMTWEEDNFFEGYRTLDGLAINFDLNDAALCVQEMQKRGEDWREFHNFARNLYYTTNRSNLKIDYNFAAWLYIAENFFGATAAWLREGEQSLPERRELTHLKGEKK